MSEDSHTIRLVFLFVSGMFLPVIASWLFHDALSVYVSGREFTYGVAVAFGLLGWAFLGAVDTDRLDFISWAIVFPWVFVLGMVVLVISTARPDGLVFLFGSIEDLVAFAASFTLAGLASVVIHERIEGVSQRYQRIPSSLSIAGGILSVLVIAVLAGGGVFTVSAMSASVSAVEPGVVEYRSSPYSSLNVTVSDPTELRLTVTEPDGHTYTKRIPRTGIKGTSVTVPVESHYLDGFPEAGTYHVELAAITGVTIDSTTYTIDDPPSPSLVGVETAEPGEPIALELPSNATGPLRSTGPTDETRIAVVIENEGEIADDFLIHLYRDGVEIDSRSLFLAPGQQGARIIAIPDEHLEAIQEGNGTVTVEVINEVGRITEEVQLADS